MKNILRKLQTSESLVMACLQNYQKLLSFASFRRIHLNSEDVMYPTSLDKIGILTWGRLAIASQIFSCELNSARNYSLANF